MRVISLNEDGGAPATLDAAVCIVGAGAAGLYLARKLAATGKSIVVLEAGPKVPVAPNKAGFDCEFSGDAYPGATEGRAFGLGGTTSRWGGQLVEFPSSDGARVDPALWDAWQHILQIGAHHRHAVEDTLGISVSSDLGNAKATIGNAEMFARCGLAPSFSRWLPFRKRNFGWLANSSNTNPDVVTIICDAVAADWRLGAATGKACRIEQVTARSASGRTLCVTAQHFVIAAGAIESTRVLLEINRLGGERVISPHSALGHYLSDHLSVSIGEFDEKSRRNVIRMFAPQFAGMMMRTWRFTELDPDPQQSRYFAHIVFPNENPGFRLARSVLQGLQARRMPTISIADLGRGGFEIGKLAWGRWARSRLHIAADAPCHLQVDMEQVPDFSSSISLSAHSDRLGRPQAKIRWHVTTADERAIATATSAMRKCWSALGPGFSLSSGEFRAFGAKPHDAYHPVGTCRIGSDTSAVTDHKLKVRGADNLFVLSTAVFPSSGSANPTFTMLCFAEMLAGELSGAIT